MSSTYWQNPIFFWWRIGTFSFTYHISQVSLNSIRSIDIPKSSCNTKNEYIHSTYRKGALMYEIIDKLLLFLCCLAFYLFQTSSSYIIIPIIVSIVLSSLFLYYDSFRIRLAGNLIYAFLCLIFPEFIIFLTLLL